MHGHLTHGRTPLFVNKGYARSEGRDSKGGGIEVGNKGHTLAG